MLGLHRTPVVGGAGNRLVTRFGRVDDSGFDPLIDLGGSLIQARIGSVTTPFESFRFDGERVPPAATVVARRRTTGLQGLGLVDAVSDDSWIAIARAQAAVDPATAGRVCVVLNLLTRLPAVGKFGWKELRSAGRLLHDGSAGTIDQAILRHDGQAAAARARYSALDPDRAAALLAFLRSL